MSKNIDRIKKMLKNSTTMPLGSGNTTTGAWLMGGHAHGHVHGPHCNHGHDHGEDCGHDHHHHDHEHKDDGSCCDH